MSTAAQPVSFLDRIRGLAQYITDRKRSGGKKFVLMLGAGASLSSGVKLTRTIMEELVAKYPQPSETSLDDAFDKLWREANPDHRQEMIEPYLKVSPSAGYGRLAELIQLGFFDIVVTFNFDHLLEDALDAAGFRDYKTIIRGETEEDAVERLIRAKEPRVKILKMHGSLRSADYFLFSKEEMLNYPEPFRSLFRDLTSADIIICGYAFGDNCVIRAFSDEKDSGAIYYVSPSGAVETIKGFLRVRRSQDRVVGGDFGLFDRFFESLHQMLTRKPDETVARIRHNVFKFFDHYSEEHKEWFFGRRKLTRLVLKKLESKPHLNLVVSGQPKVGKTSFVRAGLIPYLSPDKYECIYIRCRADFDQQMRDALSLVKAGTEKRIVAVLDQFERPARFYDQKPDRYQAAVDYLRQLCSKTDAAVSVIFVAVGDAAFWKLLAKLGLPNLEVAEVEPLSVARVGNLIRRAARRGGFTLDPKAIEILCSRYRESLSSGDKPTFTLTHLQTFCYYLARGYDGSLDDRDISNQGFLVALRSVSEDSGLTNLLDEMPADERKLIRGFLKVICDPRTNTKKIVEFIKDRFPEFKEDKFPEPIV